MEERTKNYNPADYATLEATAKSMDRKELEEYYVRDRNKRYISNGIIALIAFVILAILFMFFMFGSSMTADKFEDNIYDNAVDLQEEICPMLGDYEFTLQEEKRFWGLDEITLNCNELKE